MKTQLILGALLATLAFAPASYAAPAARTATAVKTEAVKKSHAVRLTKEHVAAHKKQSATGGKAAYKTSIKEKKDAALKKAEKK